MTSELTPLPPRSRRIFCNRTLNLHAIRAVGFDMDYTLIQYRAEEWERRAYSHIRRKLGEGGWPVKDLEFDPELVCLGLVLDLELGNIVKANRFGYIKRAAHGTQRLGFDAQRKAYSRVLVDLRESRWVFLNTLFSMSEACLFAQLVDRLEEGRLEPGVGYGDIYKVIRSNLDETHMEGELKREIIDDPEKFVILDEALPQALADLKSAGKKMLVITNSEWSYTQAMMSYALDRYLDGGRTWRDLFDYVIVSARKPSFFSHKSPVFRVDEESGLLEPDSRTLEVGGVYLGGSATLVEQQLGLGGDQILYVGDHIFSDVRASKDLFRWRTALIVPELELEVEALESFAPSQERLEELMDNKECLEHHANQLRLDQQRAGGKKKQSPELKRELEKVRADLLALDEAIGPLARAAGKLFNERWGLLMRTGNDKSHLARQVERSADVYTSRVSNLLAYTPHAYLRSPRGSLPHD